MRSRQEEAPMLVWSELERHFETGLLSIYRKEYDKAIAELQAKIVEDPDNSDWHLYLGQALYNKDLLDEAISEFNKALEIDPDAYRAYFWTSIVDAKMGQIDKSKSDYEAGQSQEEADLEIRYDWANEFAAMGRYQDAIDEYRKILEYESFTDVRVKLGIALMRSGQEEAGLKEFRFAAEASPHNIDTYLSIGEFFLTEKKINDALNEFRMAQKMAPNSPALYKHIGDIYRQKGMLDEAIGEYRKALRQRPNDPELHAGLGDLYYENGMKDDAVREYRRVKKLDPDYRLSENGERMVSLTQH